MRYMHHDMDTMERMEMIRDLRLGEFDVLVGINLLREGLDIPEVSLVAILDADKEGFLRSRNLADPDHRPRRPQRPRARSSCTPMPVTDSMERAHHRDATAAGPSSRNTTRSTASPPRPSRRMSADDSGDLSPRSTAESKREEEAHEPPPSARAMIEQLTLEMQNAAKMLEFEHAAYLRDKIKKLQSGT